MIGPDDIPVLPRGVRIHWDKVRETWVLLAPERTVTLDAAAYAVLSEIDGERSFGAIAQALAERYDAPAEQIAEDSAGLLGALRDRRFLEVAS